MLELKNLPEGALTGPPKVIYDMLIELRNSLLGEQEDDNAGLDRMCLECTSTINEYKVKVDNLRATMKKDADEAESLRNNMEAMAGKLASKEAEVDRLSYLVQFMETSHGDQLNGFDGLIQEASDVRDALMQARALIAANLQAQASPALIQTASGVSLSKKLAGISSTYKGYATLAIEFMELASNEDIVSDQKMVGELLGAMDELINQVNADITALQNRRAASVAEFQKVMQPVAEEARQANANKVAASSALGDAQSRLSNLEGKVEFDTQNLNDWTQFVSDEGVRCQNEEQSYNSRIDERYARFLGPCGVQ